MPSQVEEGDITVLAQTIGLPSYFVSAKSGEGIDKMFNEICEKLIKTTSIRRK
jgi:Fe2+ transport system protein B